MKKKGIRYVAGKPKGNPANRKAYCDGCNKIVRVRNLVRYKGTNVCFYCMRKSGGMMPFPFKCYKTLEQALAQIYEPRGYLAFSKSGSARMMATFSVPTILIGHKLKLVLVK